jgi:hypothetical protein
MGRTSDLTSVFISFTFPFRCKHFSFLQNVVWEILAQLQYTSYKKLPVVFENVRILQHLEIPERGMYVHCKYYEGAIEIG